MAVTCILIDVSYSMYQGETAGTMYDVINSLRMLQEEWKMLYGHNSLHRCLVYLFPPHMDLELVVNTSGTLTVNWSQIANRLEQINGRSGTNPFLALRSALRDNRCQLYLRREYPPKNIIIISDFEPTIYIDKITDYLNEVVQLSRQYGVKIIALALKESSKYASLLRERGFEVKEILPSEVGDAIKRYCLNV